MSEKIAIVGLGYVGLPLAVAMARKHDVVAFDINAQRIEALKNGIDATNEVSPENLRSSALCLTGEPEVLGGRDIVIVTVPTPIDEHNNPDFSAILLACELIGPRLAPGAIVVFESTVYPGATEEVCGPALEKSSGLRAGVDFKLGYSPERINPGDKEHPIEKIVKVVAGQDTETLERLADLYGSIIPAGIHRAPSIKVAEAAKVIENTQRDLNIALMNELSKICDLVGIRTSDVLAAAGTKWNFLSFHPGLVGGHCIGVDPYYLTAKAEQLGYSPQVILSGRRLNDGMGAHVARQLAKLLAKNGKAVEGAQVGILGFTFKENVPDIRNSKVVDVYAELKKLGAEPVVHDPMANADDLQKAYGVEAVGIDRFSNLDALVLTVPHKQFASLSGEEISGMIGDGGVFIDVKSRVNPASLRSDIIYWSL